MIGVPWSGLKSISHQPPMYTLTMNAVRTGWATLGCEIPADLGMGPGEGRCSAEYNPMTYTFQRSCSLQGNPPLGALQAPPGGWQTYPKSNDKYVFHFACNHTQSGTAIMRIS